MYERKTDVQIKELAKSWWAGKIFTSDMIAKEHREQMISSVFSILLVAGHQLIPQLKEHKAALLFEYFSERMPRSLNNYPCFLSVRYLDIEDTKRFYTAYNELVKVVGDPPK